MIAVVSGGCFLSDHAVSAETEGQGEELALPSVSPSLCLCFGDMTCCSERRRRDGQSQQTLVNEHRTTAKSLG